MTAMTRTLAGEATATDGEANEEGGSVHAIYLAQNVPFDFRSDTVSYTCESFKKKVRTVLIAVGVHPSLIVELRCTVSMGEPLSRPRTKSRFAGEAEPVRAQPTVRTSGSSSHISTRIALASPVIASEQNIRDATTFDAQRRLLAKVKEEELPTPSTIPIFSAVWAPIRLNSIADTWLEAEDCQLLRQLAQQVFPRLGVEVTHLLVCSGSVISRPPLEVKALMPMVERRPTAQSS
ncbi:MAG TPA: hypothetical protein VKB34_12705 [Povalibacter sp.]|nr:hypothetical protein [Povalibacter sp.]